MSDLDRARAVIDASEHEEHRGRFDLATHPRRFCTTQQLAWYLDTERRTIVRMITQGALQAVKVGREWRVDTESARQAFHIARKAG